MVRTESTMLPLGTVAPGFSLGKTRGNGTQRQHSRFSSDHFLPSCAHASHDNARSKDKIVKCS